MNAEQISFKVPLSFTAHEIADKRKKGISNAENAKKIYLNTLAVYAVNYYLDCMGFETNWSDYELEQFHIPQVIVMREPVPDKVAQEFSKYFLQEFTSGKSLCIDLEVKNVGKIECRPVFPDAEYLEIPTEVRSDRIGYVAVQFSQSLKSATILGFTTQPAAKVHLSQLQSVDNLLDYLTQKEQSAKVNIRQWLEGLITEGWQTVDEMFNPQEMSLRFARFFSITRGKKFDLGLQLNGTSVALIVKLNSESQEKIQNQEDINIVVQLHPLEAACLPPGLKLAVVEENGKEVDAVISRQKDNWIEIEFSAELDEKFSVEIISSESKVTQNFVV